MLTYNTKVKRLAWRIAVGPVILGCGLLASFVSQWYPAWPTKLFTNQTNTITAYVTEITFNRKLGMPKLHLANLDTEETFKLFWEEQESSPHIQVNKIVVLHTKHNWFGDYVVDITKPGLD